MGSVFLFRGNMQRKFRAVEYYVPIIWLLGLFAGKYIAASISSGVSDLLLSSVTQRGSFLNGILIPGAWIYIAYIALGRKPVLVLPLVFLRACLFGISGAGCSIAFGSAGWLIRILLLFSGFLHSVFFLVFCCTGLHCNRTVCRKQLLQFLTAIVVVELIDYFVISRFLISLF